MMMLATTEGLEKNDCIFFCFNVLRSRETDLQTQIDSMAPRGIGSDCFMETSIHKGEWHMHGVVGEVEILK
jgi:hypothetical protein